MFKLPAKLSVKLSVGLAIATALVLFCLQSFGAKPAFSKTPEIQALNLPTHPTTQIATATAPPKLVPAVLGGKPVYVLYVTQSEDTVLVRCYPGYEPTITLRSMGGNRPTATPNSSVPSPTIQKEGAMTCRPAT